jgi:hypothetical protein
MPDQFKYVDLRTFEDALSFDNDLPYPKWKIIGDYIRSKFAETEWSGAWREAVSQWLQKLTESLGTGYAINESPNFFMMSRRDEKGRNQLLRLAEQLLSQMRTTLKGIELRKTYGKHVILLFDDQDQYYRYVSHFHPDGNHILSAGIFLRSGGYAHIALHGTRFSILRTLSHELAHNCLMTLRLPLWLNEGMAQLLESGVSTERANGLDADLAQEHFQFWNSENIQGFWEGHAFGNPDTSRLAYSLARILLALITQEKWNLSQFVQHAEHADAGEQAAEKYLGKTLGELAGLFLGPGDWMPKPKSS